jgi:hypothetical protein
MDEKAMSRVGNLTEMTLAIELGVLNTKSLVFGTRISSSKLLREICHQ